MKDDFNDNECDIDLNAEGNIISDEKMDNTPDDFSQSTIGTARVHKFFLYIGLALGVIAAAVSLTVHIQNSISSSNIDEFKALYSQHKYKDAEVLYISQQKRNNFVKKINPFLLENAYNLKYRLIDGADNTAQAEDELKHLSFYSIHIVRINPLLKEVQDYLRMAKSYDLALNYLSEKGYFEAITELNKVNENYKEYDKVKKLIEDNLLSARKQRLELAECYFNEGNYDLAIQTIQDTLDYMKDDGALNTALVRYTKAKKSYEKEIFENLEGKDTIENVTP